jgi:hypothetical protein
VLSRSEGRAVVGAHDPLPVGQVLLEQGDRFGGAARGLAGGGACAEILRSAIVMTG